MSEEDDARPQQRGAAQPGAMAMFGALTGIAVVSAVLVVGGALLGYLLDGWTGAPHLFVFAGIVLGALLAVLSARSIVTRFFG